MTEGGECIYHNNRDSYRKSNGSNAMPPSKQERTTVVRIEI